DGFADVIVSSGPGRSGQVKVFSGIDGAVLRDVFVFARAFTGGVRVAAGDVNGDGFADLVVGTGPGTGTQVQVLSGADLSLLRIFAPYHPAFTGGVWVAAGDVTGDGFADIVTGADAGGAPHVRVIDGATGVGVLDFFAYDVAFGGGVRVAVGDVTGDGKADIITGAGPGGLPEVRVFDATTAALVSSTLAYAPVFTGGVFVATRVPVSRMFVDTPAWLGMVSGPVTMSGWAFEEL